MTTNIYQVVSEDIGYREGSSYIERDPPEPRCIAQLVAARSPGQARWLAWKADRTFENDPREMPKFSVKLRARGVNRTPGIVPLNEETAELWESET